MSEKLSHFDDTGRPHMVDIGEKRDTVRKAIATGRVTLSPNAYKIVVEEGVKKGDIASIAELAGIMGAKRTADLIPLCHPLPLTNVTLRINQNEKDNCFDVEATAKTIGKTGVEMEALTAVSVACLTIYDMAKAIDKHIVISDISLAEKTGGKSGDVKRQ